jgi:hypothetical protein
VDVGTRGEDDIADDAGVVVSIDEVSELDDKDDVDEAKSEMEEVMGMITDVVDVAEENGEGKLEIELDVGKVEGVAVVVNGVVDGAESEMEDVIGMITDVEGVAVVVNSVVDGSAVAVVMEGATVVAVVVCGADGRTTVGGNEYPP